MDDSLLDSLADAALAEFEDWRLADENSSFEDFVRWKGLAPEVAEVVRQHLKVECQLRGALLGQTSCDRATETGGQRPQIGRYQLIQRIGQGGMGIVWLAEQIEPIKRQVAVKLVRTDRVAPEFIRRFASERQNLSAMNHPSIARVYDAGETEDQSPYLVMEYVEGLPLAEFCRTRQLRLRTRIELFIELCHGIQHAHQKAVIHRDLKPSNVMVSTVDGRPRIKVIDFGLAKALRDGSARQDGESITQIQGPVGSIPYMSPEQTQGSPPGIGNPGVDTRSDVYSLGVILYELLTGDTPVSRGELRRMGPLEAMERVRNAEAKRPSGQILRDPARAPSVLEEFGVSPQHLAKQVARDLDWIVLKALEKDLDRRYDSAAAFAQELSRFLDDRPVEARPPTLGYRLAKVYRRNKVATLAGAGAVLSLAVGLIVSMTLAANWFHAAEMERQANHLLEQRNEDLRETQKARSVLRIVQAARSGQWSEALGSTEQYKNDFGELTPELRISRVIALDGLLDNDAAKREILALHAARETQDFNRSIEARIDLWFAYLFVLDPQRRTAARKVLQELIANRAADLSPADLKFAQGLVQGQTAGAEITFRQALKRSPFHLPARVELVVNLILRGQYQAVQDEIRNARSFFPQDPRFEYAAVLAHASAGEQRKTRQAIDEFAARYPNQDLSGLEQFAELISLLNSSVALSEQNVSLTFWLSLASRFRAVVGHDPGVQLTPQAFMKPTLIDALQIFAAGVLSPRYLNPLLSEQDRRKAFGEICRRAYAAHPDGMFKLLEGIAATDVPFGPAAELFEEAIASESLFPAVRRTALFFAGSLRGAEYATSTDQERDPSLLVKATRQLEEFLNDEPRLTHQQATILVAIFGRAGKWDLAKEVAERRVAQGGDPLATWNHLLDQAAKRNAPLVALEACERILKIAPDRAEVRRRRAQLIENLSRPRNDA